MDKSNDNLISIAKNENKHIRSKQKSLINAKDVLDRIKAHYCGKKHDKPWKIKILRGK